MDDEHDLTGKICVKCDLDAKFAGVDPKKAWYCENCFIHSVKNRFRTALSKIKVFKDPESRDCLVVYDGTPSASFLLHQVDDALRQVNFKRLMIQPTMLVLVSVTGSEEIAQVVQKVQEIKKVLVDKVRWIIAHVSCCLLEECQNFGETLEVCYGAEKVPEFQKVLDSVSNETNRQELERIMKEKSLRNISRWTGISKIMCPEEGDTLGRLALTQLCLGRGGILSDSVAVVDRRETFTIIRPLRNISKKEIGIVNYLCDFNKDVIYIKDSDPSSKPANSIQNLTDEFVQTLENEKFYSTINTVLSTAGKIHGIDEGKKFEKCNLCEIDKKSIGDLCVTCDLIKSSSSLTDTCILEKLF